MISRPFKKAGLVCVLAAFWAPTLADAPNYGPMDRPLSRQQAAFIERSLKGLGLSETANLASKTLTTIPLPKSTLWFARVNDAHLCVAERCLTFIVEGAQESDWKVGVMIYGGPVSAYPSRRTRLLAKACSSSVAAIPRAIWLRPIARH